MQILKKKEQRKVVFKHAANCSPAQELGQRLTRRDLHQILMAALTHKSASQPAFPTPRICIHIHSLPELCSHCWYLARCLSLLKQSSHSSGCCYLCPPSCCCFGTSARTHSLFEEVRQAPHPLQMRSVGSI